MATVAQQKLTLRNRGWPQSRTETLYGFHPSTPTAMIKTILILAIVAAAIPAALGNGGTEMPISFCSITNDTSGAQGNFYFAPHLSNTGHVTIAQDCLSITLSEDGTGPAQSVVRLETIPGLDLTVVDATIHCTVEYDYNFYNDGGGNDKFAATMGFTSPDAMTTEYTQSGTGRAVMEIDSFFGKGYSELGLAFDLVAGYATSQRNSRVIISNMTVRVRSNTNDQYLVQTVPGECTDASASTESGYGVCLKFHREGGWTGQCNSN